MTSFLSLCPATVSKARFRWPAQIRSRLHKISRTIAIRLYGLSNGILTIVRGTVPRKLFGRENYGPIVGALIGSTLMAQAAGPLVITGLLEGDISSKAVFTTLLTFSLGSASFYFAAVRQQPVGRRSKVEQSLGGLANLFY